jgi:stearoyl-CoA desaturase (delta-9 desaturase)
MHVLREYAAHVIIPVLELELSQVQRNEWGRVPHRLLTSNPSQLDEIARRRLRALLETCPALETVYECQEGLRQLWETPYPTQDALTTMFSSWCVRAEASRIKALAEFAGRLRRFSLL